MKMNPVVHFEMPTENGKRTSEFYTKVFGWKMRTSGPEMGNYVVAITTDSDSNGRPVKPGAINGGFFVKDPGKSAKHPSVVISVDDIRSSMKDVEREGGKILGDPVDIPGVGTYVSFTDTEGNLVSMLEPRM